MKKGYDTIIIGGGISGLACAKTLHDAGKDFLLISKDFGGRMKPSTRSSIGYGGAYLTKNCKNVLKYAEKVDRFRLRDTYFQNGDKFESVFTWKNLKLLPSFLRLRNIVKKVSNRSKILFKKMENKTIGECLQEDSFSMKYWNMSVREFIKGHGFEALDRKYCNLIADDTAMDKKMEMNALTYLVLMEPLVLKTWAISFTNTVKKIALGFKDRILKSKVNKVVKTPSGFSVRCAGNSFPCKNIVFAAPWHAMEGVYDLPRPSLIKSTHTFHLIGTRKVEYQNKKILIFKPGHDSFFAIWRQKDGTDFIYSNSADPPLQKYYSSYEQIGHTHWKDALTVPTPRGKLVSQILGDGAYLASDYNLSTLEASFLTGVFAANQIIKKSKK